MSKLVIRLLPCLLLLPLAPVSPLAAQVPQVHALTGVRIVVSPGRTVESGTVVLRDGVIGAVGAAVEPPPDARVWEREGLTVYPGLIEPYAVRPWPEREEGAEPQGLHPNRLVRPQREMARFAWEAGWTSRLREAGFTTALVAPGDGVFRGRSALLNLGEEGLPGNLLRERVAHHAAFESGSFGGGYPTSLMGAIALFRQTLLDARWYEEAHAAYARNPAQTRPDHVDGLEILAAVARGREPIVLESSDLLATLRIHGLARELGLDVWVVGNGEEYRRLEAIRRSGLTHLLPVDFPEPPAVGEEDDLQVGLEDLRHWDRAPDNPRLLLAAGLTVALTTHRLDQPRDLHARVARAIERGLSREDALAAVTTTPARLLGIADRAGTVEPGKMANLVVVDGDLLVDKPEIREVWIDGRRYKVRDSDPPTVEPAGAWDLQVETPEGSRIPVTLELSGPATDLGGHLVAMGSRIELASAYVSGNRVEMSFDGSAIGMPGTFELTMEVRGDRAVGSGFGPTGAFSFTGTKTTPATPEVTR